MNKITILLKNLEKRRFIPKYFETISEANEYIKTIIPKNSTIGFGGSVTVMEMDMLDALNKDYNLLHRSLFDKKLSQEINNKMHFADWYISSTNAITVEGDLVNIDGRANRVADILNGPKNIIIVCGTNKIVNNITEGIERTRNIAAPLNAKKLNKNTPCTKTGKCEHCNSIETICNATVIQHHPTSDKNVFIIIINKNLGY